MDLRNFRRSYDQPELAESAVADEPLAQFEAWLQDAIGTGIGDPNAMTLATVGADGRPSTRVVLIRLNYSVEFRYGVLVDIARRVLAEEPVDVTMGHVNVIWQRDAIETILRAHAVAANAAQPLNVTGAAVLRVRDLAEDFGRLFGVTPRFTGTEAPTAWLNDASFSHQRWGVPPTTLETMEQWVASWLAAGYPTWGKPTGFEKRDGQF